MAASCPSQISWTSGRRELVPNRGPAGKGSRGRGGEGVPDRGPTEARPECPKSLKKSKAFRNEHFPDRQEKREGADV